MCSAYCYGPNIVVCLSPSEPCKNGWSDRDAVCVEDAGGPREATGQSPPSPTAFRFSRSHDTNLCIILSLNAAYGDGNIVTAMKKNCSAMATNTWWRQQVSWRAYLSTHLSQRHHADAFVVVRAAPRQLNVGQSSCGSSSEICSSCRSATTQESAGSTAMQVQHSFNDTVLSVQYRLVSQALYLFRSEWYRRPNSHFGDPVLHLITHLRQSRSSPSSKSMSLIVPLCMLSLRFVSGAESDMATAIPNRKIMWYGMATPHQ